MNFGVNSFPTLQVAFGAPFIASVRSWVRYLFERICVSLASWPWSNQPLNCSRIPSVVHGFFAFIYIGPLVVELGEVEHTNGWTTNSEHLNPINGDAIVVGLRFYLWSPQCPKMPRARSPTNCEKVHCAERHGIENMLRGCCKSPHSESSPASSSPSQAVGETTAVNFAVGTVAVYTSGRCSFLHRP